MISSSIIHQIYCTFTIKILFRLHSLPDAQMASYFSQIFEACIFVLLAFLVTKFAMLRDEFSYSACQFQHKMMATAHVMQITWKKSQGLLPIQPVVIFHKFMVARAFQSDGHKIMFKRHQIHINECFCALKSKLANCV